MDTCVKLEKFKSSLIKDINECNLSIGAAFFVVKDVYNMLFQSYQETLKIEIDKEESNNAQEEKTLIIPINSSNEENLSEKGE